MARLFCIPYAGGSAAAYARWRESVPEIDLRPVELPGRGARIREPPLRRMQLLVDDVVAKLAPFLDEPFAIFGHSMGALVAFECARELRRRGLPAPLGLLVSGSDAPHALPEKAPVFRLPESEFIAELRRYNGTPEAVLAHPELLAILLPALRGDFEIVQTYVYEAEPPLDLPIAAATGTGDATVTRALVERWGEVTRGRFSLAPFPGEHFFVHTATDAVLGWIARVVKDLTDAAAAARLR